MENNLIYIRRSIWTFPVVSFRGLQQGHRQDFSWPNTYFKIRRMTCYQFFVYECSYQTVLKGFKPCRCNQFCPECSVAKSKVESSKHRWICSDYAITSFQWTSIVAVRYSDTITAPKTYFYKNIHFPYKAQVSFASEGNLKMRWSIWLMEIIMEIYIWGKNH